MPIVTVTFVLLDLSPIVIISLPPSLLLLSSSQSPRSSAPHKSRTTHVHASQELEKRNNSRDNARYRKRMQERETENSENEHENKDEKEDEKSEKITPDRYVIQWLE